MLLQTLMSVQYCYTYLIDQTPVGLLLYSHIPTALSALLFSGYVIFKDRSRSSYALFLTCVSFALWCALDISSWFDFSAPVTMFVWSLLDLVALLMFFFGYYFLYTFVSKKDLPMMHWIAGLLLIVPTVIATFWGLNLTSFDANACQANEREYIALYPYFVEGIFILASLIFSVRAYLATGTKQHKREILLVSIGVLAFLIFFFSSTLGVNILVSYDSLASYAYNFEIYGLFGMPILLIYLGYLIVRYKAFNLKMFGAQALILALIGVLGAEFAFVSSLASRVLVAITLVLTGWVGILLIRSVKREIEQREHIELLAKDLELANKQQVILIHFITHQIKGFVAKSRNIFSLILEGDFGPVPEAMKPMIEEGFKSDTKGAQTIQEILNAANIKSGKVTYTKVPIDLKALVDDVAKNLQHAADAKGIALNVNTGEAPLMYTADRTQLENAIKNLIDNSIKYTPKGEVDVTLKQEAGKVHFEIKDTGVGITPEDMKKLFTEGGHGAESQKVNVESTGFGLFIVKNIIEAHGGKVWAESEGHGKGSRFIVELPT